jgi:hypothetical protein
VASYNLNKCLSFLTTIEFLFFLIYHFETFETVFNTAL